VEIAKRGRDLGDFSEAQGYFLYLLSEVLPFAAPLGEVELEVEKVDLFPLKRVDMCDV